MPYKMLNGQVTLISDEEAAEIASGGQTTLAPAITYKGDIWRRTTEEEAEMLDALLATTSAKMRRLFDGVAYISHDAPEYQMMLAAVATALGSAERAVEILAPSET